MKVYINGTGIISPQAPDITGPDDLRVYTQNRLHSQEPDYKNYIAPAQLRRMSRMIKMGLASARMCLADSGIEKPDAIITGTGLGCLEDTEKFLVSIVDNNEQMLSPTPFIQSTHNTVGGQIALVLQCHGYNFTYVHRGLSFESSLADAVLLLQEATAHEILVGGLDELTDTSFGLLQQLGLYHREGKNTLATSYTMAGEGAAFFALSSEKNDRTKAALAGIATWTGATNTTLLAEKTAELLNTSGKTPTAVSLVFTGSTGDSANEDLYTALQQEILPKASFLPYKKYCGEYPTATAFALWLAVLHVQASDDPASTVLIYNSFDGIDHSLLLVEKSI
jgi:3-oxoacyl-[acyl-carrier-protein] synthase II